MDETLARDGVVLLRGALSAGEVAEVEHVFDHVRPRSPQGSLLGRR